MNTMPKTQEVKSNIVDISFRNTTMSNTTEETKKEKTRGFTSDGRPVPKAADSIKTIKEVNKIRNYFLDKKEYRNYMLWMLGICTAYRCGDILSFKFSDIFEEDKITFKRNISLYEEKTGKYREMEITEPMKQAINKYVESINNNFELNDYLFQSRKGDNKHLEVRSVEKIFSNMGEDLKLPYNVSTHTMRKTFAYFFITTHKNDITALTTLMELLNHSSEKITLAYAGISKEERRNMARDVSNLWDNI